LSTRAALYSRAAFRLCALLEAIEAFRSSLRLEGLGGICVGMVCVAVTAAAAPPSWGVRGARPPLAGGWGRGGTGRGWVPTNLRVGAPPAVLCPPARGAARLGPTNNLKVWCEEVGKELGKKLLEEWDDPVLEPWEVTRGSGHRARWRCRECTWSFYIQVGARTKSVRPSGCPACSGRVATAMHNLALACEQSEGRLAHLPGEWNHPTERMEDFTPSAGERVPWKCRECGGEWSTTVNHRTRHDRPGKCPDCQSVPHAALLISKQGKPITEL